MVEQLAQPVETFEFATFEAVREALFDRDLSRAFDKRAFHEGNVRDGVVSISHGATHRARRRVENMEFRPQRLRLYERDLFPGVLAGMLDRLIDREHIDLFAVAELLSVVLAARRAGIDHDPASLDQLHALIGYVDAFSQVSAILDARDPEAVRELGRRAWASFEAEFVRPSWTRRREAVEAFGRGDLAEDELPDDILTALLVHRADPQVGLEEDGRIVREVGTYLQGGTHTSAQTLCNALDLLFPLLAAEPAWRDRLLADPLLAQRAIHETLRLRPTTPRIKRLAEADTVVAGTPIPRGSVVVLDAAAANRDERLFGADPDRFDPDRTVDDAVPRWGLSFGLGPHQCPGRSVAGGFPVPAGFAVGDEHLFGLVAPMLREVIGRGVRPDPDRPPQRDRRTVRDTRWSEFPVLFPSARHVTAAG